MILKIFIFRKNFIKKYKSSYNYHILSRFKGDHRKLLEKQQWEVDYLRGPLNENDLINIISDYDGILCGDDDYTDNVIKKELLVN